MSFLEKVRPNDIKILKAESAKSRAWPGSFLVAVYPSEDAEGGAWTAHCLAMDLIADGEDRVSAIHALGQTIEASFEGARKHDANVWRDAPDEYWAKSPSHPELEVYWLNFPGGTSTGLNDECDDNT